MCHKLQHIFSISGAGRHTFIRHRTTLCTELDRGDGDWPPFLVKLKSLFSAARVSLHLCTVLGSAWHNHSSADIVQWWLVPALSKTSGVAHKFTQLHGCICGLGSCVCSQCTRETIHLEKLRESQLCSVYEMPFNSRH